MNQPRQPSLPRQTSTWSAVMFGLSIAVFAGLAGCRQKVGERCQVNADCDEGLVCNMGKDPPVCDDETSGMAIDALPPPDAPPDAP